MSILYRVTSPAAENVFTEVVVKKQNLRLEPFEAILGAVQPNGLHVDVVAALLQEAVQRAKVCEWLDP